MIESPVLEQFVEKRAAERVAKALQESLLATLKRRFTAIPQDLVEKVQAVTDERKLKSFLEEAAVAPDLNAFTELVNAQS